MQMENYKRIITKNRLKGDKEIEYKLSNYYSYRYSRIGHDNLKTPFPISTRVVLQNRVVN